MMQTVKRQQRSHNLRAISATVDADALHELDGLVTAGHFINRSVAVDNAIKMLLGAYRAMPLPMKGDDDADAA